jgi:hypothetical protein
MAKHIWTSLTLLALLASCFAGAGKSGCDFDRHWRCFGAYGRYGGRVGGDGDYAGSLDIRMKQKGFKELIFAGKFMSQPLTGTCHVEGQSREEPRTG